MRYAHIVFDFFGVICSEVAPFWLARYLEPEVAVAVKADLVGAADRGDISQATLFTKLAELASVTPEGVAQEWRECARLDPRVIDLVKRVAAEGEVSLLSNSPAPFVRELLFASGIESLFTAVVVSSEVGWAKPDRRIYVHLVESLGIRPTDMVLIDDNPVNLIGARDVGIAGVLFESPCQVERALGL